MTRGRRFLAALLTAFPATWGLCVTWLVAPVAPAEARAEAPAACCCDCQESCPHRAPEPAPRKKDCDGCGLRDAGRGVLPGDAVARLPDVAASPVVPVVDPPQVAAVAVAPAPDAWAAGPPSTGLARLEGVVLLV